MRKSGDIGFAIVFTALKWMPFERDGVPTYGLQPELMEPMHLLGVIFILLNTVCIVAVNGCCEWLLRMAAVNGFCA